MVSRNLLFLAVVLSWAASGRSGGSEDPAPEPGSAWKNGPARDPGYFPIAVWLQDPRNAARYREAGFNLYVGLWKGPTERQLEALRAAGMRVICEQNQVGLAHRSDPTIAGWMHGDEPDNAQSIRDPATGRESYGPPVPPAKVVEGYRRMRAADPTRPVLLNLGQGVANDEWIGRGSGASLDDYPAYLKGCDLASFDVYPVAGLEKKKGEDHLWYVAKGVDRLVRWTRGEKVVWNCLECTSISGGKKATPPQVRSEAWMALVHGSRGLIYFVHQFKPKFIEAGLLADPEMLSAVKSLNQEIRGLAPVLNAPELNEAAVVKVSPAEVPVDFLVKRQGGATYLFAVGMRNAPARASFAVIGLPARTEAEVLGEGRKIALEEGSFEDRFTPYQVHLYRIR
jgi:hypothetical protein